jgi:hypothetical protein
MATDFIRINSFHVCKKFNLSKYVCELPPEKRICDGVCIKLPEMATSGELVESAENSVNV